MPDFSVAVALLKKPIEDLYASASGTIKEKLAQHRATSKVQKLHKRLWESQRVKTIWHTDRPLSLISFFYPVSVSRRTDGGATTFRLNSLSDLPDLHTTILGTVGQGKSILLRYLLGKEIKSGERIPVLCELRNVAPGNLEEYLAEKFCTLLDIQKDIDLLRHFGANGKISFLLDGFDEIESANVQSLMQEIDSISVKFPLCRIVITSRPDSDCKHLTSFYTVDIEKLKLDDLHGFYKKVTRDSQFTDRLLSAIKASPLQIRNLISTPLLATLLAISYRAAQKIPLDFAEFYDELFQILLIRHDGAKQGWRRLRKSKLNDREIQQVFEAFCFASRKRGISAIDQEVAYTISEESLKYFKISADPQNFVDDIRKITCLLMEDGKKLSFVHSSVQEFFAARYIKTRADSVAASFYAKLQVGGTWQKWKEELMFLEQIDAHRARKHFFVPDLRSTLSLYATNQSPIEKGVVEQYLSGIAVRKKVVTKDGTSVTSYYVHHLRTADTYQLQGIDARAFNLLFNGGTADARPWRSGFTENPSSTERTYLQISMDRGESFHSNLLSSLIAVFTDLQQKLNLLTSLVETEESTVGFVDLDDI